jgi:ribonucleoside-diphosphate reductase alpha subunit
MTTEALLHVSDTTQQIYLFSSYILIKASVAECDIAVAVTIAGTKLVSQSNRLKARGQFNMHRLFSTYVTLLLWLTSLRSSESSSNHYASASVTALGSAIVPVQKGHDRQESESSVLLSSSTIQTQMPLNKVIMVTKVNNATQQPFDANKIKQRLDRLVVQDPPLNQNYVNVTLLLNSIVRGVFDGISSQELDGLIAESAASLGTQHADYAQLAARVLLSQARKHTPRTFSDAMCILHDHGILDEKTHALVQAHAALLNAHVQSHNFSMTYFGFKTLERSYLLRDNHNQLVERPEYLLMRVALGIHGDSIADALETYKYMSGGYLTHASPTLFHAGTTHAQLSSCFLVQMSDDSINGIYDTLKQCAVISKAAGGIGLSVHNIRARGTRIQGTRGVSNGLVPMLRVYDVTSRYVDQGGGKRPGAFAVYLEPWHADVFDVLNLKKNHGKEEQRARDLFYGLWIPDLFMRRVQEDGAWSLFCPHQCPGLQDCYGKEFEELYEQYERGGRFVRKVRARELWGAILESQIETGTPYMLYKDACNSKSNQKNLGTIQCSNLCTEIIQYTDKEEVAVCNLASICLPKFVVSDRGPFGSVRPESGRAYYDHEALHKVAKIVTKNLNKIIDLNCYPVEGSKLSNFRHRPIGIGVSGLADVFIRLGLPFTCPEAKQLNEAIFETIYHAALEASAELAEKDGPYATFAGSPTSRGELQHDLWGTADSDTPSNRFARREIKQPRNQRYADELQSKGYKWDELRQRIKKTGLRNSLLVAPMPTASTSQILGVNECFEPFSSNLYVRRVKAGEFIMANQHLLQDLTDRGLWTPAIRNEMMRFGGSIQNIPEIPDDLKELYKTVWEIKMKDIIDMSADRGKFVDQSQSLNLFIADPTADKLTAMHFYAWKKGLKTGMYYLRTKPAVNAIQYTVDRRVSLESLPIVEPESTCLSCQG